MAAITLYPDAIVKVNQALKVALDNKFKADELNSIVVRFDLPDVNSTQSVPTISVFLYDVHEDLQLRQSELFRMNINNTSRQAGWVNLNCNYLITYWEAHGVASDGDGPDSSPDNQAIKVITSTLQALLQNRELSGLEGSYTRVIPPQENLNSLGNFWQALGNRPRLSLVYSVTMPMKLDNTPAPTPVKTVSSEITQTASVDLNALNRLLLQTLSVGLGSDGKQTLRRVTLDARPQPGAEETGAAIAVKLVVSGLVDSSTKESLDNFLDEWSKSKNAVAEINGVGVYITQVDYGNLNGIKI